MKTIKKHEKTLKKPKKYEKHEKTCFSCFFWIGGDFCQEQSEILICRALWPPVPPWVAGLGTTSPLRGQCVTEFENPPPPAPAVLGSYMDYVHESGVWVPRHGCVFLLCPPPPLHGICYSSSCLGFVTLL